MAIESSFWTLVPILLFATFVSSQIPFEWSPWKPPWDEFDKKTQVVAETYYGYARGFSVQWHIDDSIWYPEWDEIPPWFRRRINCWLGIPYAEPPVGELRFKRPRPPRWPRTVETTMFGPACPQKVEEIRKDIPEFPRANISEDCLYMNVFAPNLTIDHSRQTLYPVMVFFHGGDFLHGNSQQFPGHVLATKMVVVVTVNYRLGALGFLSTEDEHAAGNWGLWDQHLALTFIKDNIKAFRGDPEQITIMGHEAGAMSVGLHMISPLSRQAGQYFHQAIMMDGTDLSPTAIVHPFWRPREYAAALGKELGCPDYDDSYLLLRCLRKNSTIHWESIIQAQDRIKPVNGPLGRVWGPVQDGGFYHSVNLQYEEFLPELPVDLRRQGLYPKIPVMVGIDKQAGAKRANSSVTGLCEGMFPQTFRNFMKQTMIDWRLEDIYKDRAFDAVEFQYTYWADPENLTARSQEFINFFTDYEVGTGMDQIIKGHMDYESSFMYVNEYRSWNSIVPWCYGTGFDAIIPYVFGVPFMNETVLNETYLEARQWFDYEERNVSDCFMTWWTNFAKYRQPTLNVTCNITWDPFNDYNLTYLQIETWPNLWFHYRQSKYGFWREYFPTLARQKYFHPTATPTPAGRQYIYSTGGLSAVLLLLLIILGVCIYLLVHQSRLQEEDDAYHDSEIPLSFGRSRDTSKDTSVSTVSRRSPYQAPSPEYQYHRPPYQMREYTSGGYASSSEV